MANSHSTEAVSEGTGKLDNLQILRFVAAALVLLAHLKFATGELGIPVFDGAYGAVGVDIFFVISGFVISLSAAKLGKNYRLFLAHRFARVAPLFYLTSGYFLFRELIGGGAGISLDRVWNTFAFIPIFDVGSLSGHYHEYGWTLSFEMWFYLLFGVSIWHFGAEHSTKVVPFALVGLVVLMPLFPLGSWYFPKFASSPLVLEFCAGILLYRLKSRIGTHAFVGSLTLLPLAAWGVFSTERLGWHREVLDDSGVALFRALIWGGLGVCVTIVALHLDLTRRNYLPRIFVKLGDASYSLYLIQPFALKAGARLIGEPGALQGAVFLGVALLGGLALYHFVERSLSAAARRTFEGMVSAK